MQNGTRFVRSTWLVGLGIAVVLAPGSARGQAGGDPLGPESPQIRRAIEWGITFIESGAENDSRMGAQALLGLALLKHGSHPDHPQVKQAAANIQKSLAGREPGQLRSNNEIYSVGLAAIFLLELDPATYRSEIEQLLDILRRTQKPHGGWGYADRETGDTSMVQYAALAMWEARRAGFTVPQPMIEGLTEWLLRTQDPSGGYGYQGNVSPSWQPVPQSQIRLSLTAAGLGSLYICADLLGFAERAPQREEGIPSALQEVREEEPADRRIQTRIDPALIRAAQRRGNQWMAHNFQAADEGSWIHYYLYGLERYMSFREAHEGDGHRIPWYRAGAAFLLQDQEQRGSWTGRGGAPADTAFALLFLMRSMQRSIDKAQGLGAGLMVGGRGLPKDTDRVEVRLGQVIARPLMGPAEELLAMLDDTSGAGYDRALDQLAELTPEEAQRVFGGQPDRLRRLARDASPQARIAAAHALGLGRNLDVVPLLIQSLDDPDPGVVRAARDALRRLARKPAGFGLPDAPSDAERAAAIRQWKAWYLAVRPNAEFES